MPASEAIPSGVICFRRANAVEDGLEEVTGAKWLVRVPSDEPYESGETVSVHRAHGPETRAVLGELVAEDDSYGYWTITKSEGARYRRSYARPRESKLELRPEVAAKLAASGVATVEPEPVAAEPEPVAPAPAGTSERETHEASGLREHYCKAGGHYYMRAPTRGRQPENCPEHGGRSRAKERGEATMIGAYVVPTPGKPEPESKPIISADGSRRAIDPEKAARAAAPAEAIETNEHWALASKLIGGWPYSLLYGPPGTGKTHTALAVLSARGHERVVNCYITPETTAAELMGYSAPDASGSFVWRDGPITSAMRNGWPLVINEIDDVAGDAETALIGALDDPGVAQYELMSGETIRPAEGFAVVATMNGTPDVLRPALADRLPYRFNITEVHPAAIKRLPEDLREAAKRSTDPSTGERRQSIRAWLAFAAARENGLSEQEAAAAVWQGSAEDVLNVLRMVRASDGSK